MVSEKKPDMSQMRMPFDGATFVEKIDGRRLGNAMARVYHLMKDGKWRTLGDVAFAAHCSESGAGARLRDFRKDKFKPFYPDVEDMERKRVSGGVWQYRLVMK